MTIPAGGSSPLHVHGHEDDNFYVLDVRLAIRCGDRAFVAGTGDYLALPKGLPRTFRALVVRPARLLMTQKPTRSSASSKRSVSLLRSGLPSSTCKVDSEVVARASGEIGHALRCGASMTEEEAQQIAADSGALPPGPRARIGGGVGSC